ncbi:MAG: RNA polymerase subunit sigma-70 [Streptosporangiaceae bacterium]
MNQGGPAVTDEPALLAAAAAGDDSAFDALVAGYHSELRAHCYRMLGSLHDAEDALQDALLRAWRGLPGFQGRSSLRSWLYAIVTNAALDVARQRARRELPVDFSPAAVPGATLAEPAGDLAWLEPFPDRLFPGPAALSPEARYEHRESIELAFVVALQLLPPVPRAVFLLREVLGFSAAEIAIQLSTTPAAVTSTLQRARARIRRRLPAVTQQTAVQAIGDERVRVIVERYSSALERGDADALISMLTHDATWSMPPIPTWFSGHEHIREFLVRWPLTERWKHLPASANGQLAVAGYLYDAGRRAFVPAVIDVLTMSGTKIAAVTGFLTPAAHGRPPAADARGPDSGGADVFARFGLPAAL